MSDKLDLPGSGYDVISKILHAYALCGNSLVSLDEVASKAGMAKTLVSKNNGFLSSMGLISGGKSKILTDQGRTLAIALGHDLDEDISQAWKKIILESPAMKAVLDMIQVQKAITVNALPAKIASTLGAPDSPMTRTGTNTLVEILKKSGLLIESDGKYSIIAEVPKPITPIETEPLAAPGPLLKNDSLSTTRPQPGQESPVSKISGHFPIHVNIELHLPASSEQSVYDAIFKSIRENLIS